MTMGTPSKAMLGMVACAAVALGFLWRSLQLQQQLLGQGTAGTFALARYEGWCSLVVVQVFYCGIAWSSAR